MPRFKTSKFKVIFEDQPLCGWISNEFFPPEEAESMAIRLSMELDPDTEDVSVFTGCVPALETAEPTESDRLRLYKVENRQPYKLARLVGLGVRSDGFTEEVMKSMIHMLSENTQENLNKGYYTWDELLGPSSPSKMNDRVEKVLSKIYSRAPFRVYYLDSNGLKAWFMGGIRPKEADYIAKWIAKLKSDTDATLGLDGLIVDLVNTGRMHLWWD